MLELENTVTCDEITLFKCQANVTNLPGTRTQILNYLYLS